MSVVGRLLRRVQLVTVLGGVLLSLGLWKTMNVRDEQESSKQRNTLKAARRSMAMAEEERVAV